MKTPEELAEYLPQKLNENDRIWSLAEDWIEQQGWNQQPFADDYENASRKEGFVAGYKAAKERYEARVKELEDSIIQSVDAMAGVKYDDENT